MRTVLMATALLAFTFATPAAAADVNGTWKRPNGDTVEVSGCGGGLCARITGGAKKGMEMFHGMSKAGGTKWKGAKMKHPDMPGFMTFNGTVTHSGDKLEVKGCAIGESMCDAETWSRGK
ncbi:MAG: DUF2147 domain-containing protein [Hyphomicrobiaceae bacterium]